MRIALGIEYDGSRFSGWQRLSHARTVQAEVERAIGTVAAQPVHVVCAGRTDAGVHASGQVIHFDTESLRPVHAWVMGVNASLPDDVSVRWAMEVSSDFHARYSAISRAYRYVILNRGARSALYSSRATWVRAGLDAGVMHEAAQALVGEHDFSSFRAAGCQARHPVRRIEEIGVHRSGDFVYVDVRANAFLHHMVRNIAGALIAVGTGARPSSWMAELLALRNRDLGGVTAAPQGLYLVGVRYPANFGIPAPGAPLIFS